MNDVEMPSLPRTKRTKHRPIQATRMQALRQKPLEAKTMSYWARSVGEDRCGCGNHWRERNYVCPECGSTNTHQLYQRACCIECGNEWQGHKKGTAAWFKYSFKCRCGATGLGFHRIELEGDSKKKRYY